MKHFQVTLTGWDHRQLIPALLKAYLDKHPNATQLEMAKALKLSHPTVYKYLRAGKMDVPFSVPAKKRVVVDFSPLLKGRGASVVVPGYDITTCRVYAARWNRNRGGRMSFSYEQVNGGTKVTRRH